MEKASYHAVRRAFAPVLASFRGGAGDALELWISNDTLSTVEGGVVATLEALDGTVEQSWTLPFSAASGGHAVPWRAALPARPDRVLRAVSSSRQFETARHLFVPISALALEPDARPDVAVERLSATKLRVTLGAPTWLAFVHLTSRRADLRFSDNHFDLAAGEHRTVTVTAASAFGPDDLTIRCWNDRKA
ncbi:MAG: hypothetical protein EON85_00750 [Brevundimonas sp.]|nr:MAG: hypothetical protein EON85_00750 [Brevundimonas sp.]